MAPFIQYTVKGSGDGPGKRFLLNAAFVSQAVYSEVPGEGPKLKLYYQEFANKDEHGIADLTGDEAKAALDLLQRLK